MFFHEYDRLDGHSTVGTPRGGKFFRLDLGEQKQMPIDQAPFDYDTFGTPLDEDGANPSQTGLWLYKDEEANPSTGRPGRTHVLLDGIELGGIWDPSAQAIRTLEWGGKSLQAQTVKIGIKAGGVVLPAESTTTPDGTTVIDLGALITDKTILKKQNHLIVNNKNGNCKYGDDRTTALRFLDDQDTDATRLQVMYDNATIKLNADGELFAVTQVPEYNEGLSVDAAGRLNVNYDNASIKLSTDNKLYVPIDGTTISINTAQQLQVPTATPLKLGVVKPDNDTITIDANGFIHASAGLSNNGIAAEVVPDPAYTSTKSKINVLFDDTTIKVGIDNKLYAVTATDTNKGVVIPDNDTITIDNTTGQIKSTQINPVTALAFDTTNKYDLNVLYDDKSIKVDADNKLYAFVATNNEKGIIVPDGETTVIINEGTLHAKKYLGRDSIIVEPKDDHFNISVLVDGNTDGHGASVDDPTILQATGDKYLYVKTAESPVAKKKERVSVDEGIPWTIDGAEAYVIPANQPKALVYVYDPATSSDITDKCFIRDEKIVIMVADLPTGSIDCMVTYTYEEDVVSGGLGVVIPDGDTITIDTNGVISATQIIPGDALKRNTADKYKIHVVPDSKFLAIDRTDPNNSFITFTADGKTIIFDTANDCTRVAHDGFGKTIGTDDTTETIFYDTTKGLYTRKAVANGDTYGTPAAGTEIQPLVPGNAGRNGVLYPDGLTILQDANGKISIPTTQFNSETSLLVDSTNNTVPTTLAMVKYVTHLRKQSVHVSTGAADTPKGVIWYDTTTTPRTQIIGTLEASAIADPLMLYLVPEEDVLSGNYVQYITISTTSAGVTTWQWEKLGSTHTDLRDYIHKTNTVAGVPFYNPAAGDPETDKNITSKELEPNLFATGKAIERVDDATVSADHYTLNVLYDDKTIKINADNKLYANIDGLDKTEGDPVTLLYDDTKKIYVRKAIPTTYTDVTKTVVLKEGTPGISYADGKTVLQDSDGELSIAVTGYDSTTHDFTSCDDQHIPSTKAVCDALNDAGVSEKMLEAKVTSGRLIISKMDNKQALLNRSLM